jgi:hypothetical protein
MKPKNEVKVLLSKQDMIDDLSLVHPECKSQIPHMVEMMQDHIETMVSLAADGAFWLGWNSARTGFKNALLFRTFVAILVGSFFITFGEMLIGKGLLATLLGAATGTAMFALFGAGIEGIFESIKEFKKGREKDEM